ncbi:uncharacterized protein LOC110062097 isoform X4 [Orbicella faveolata]|uniref:uncharacterized protein LOC110062079 n=1 Tax=Orbicella faveolata TaxID=48498 RepID=UPI0009E62A6B|nr:uncharacterized protein LOC110062079 [Orbicella faveolata]XP_020624614.1 uncharacterized protein LOC110062097 isoform X4 [Orbicella faveolata]
MFLDDSQELTGKVCGTICKIKTQVCSSECEIPDSPITDQPSSPPDTDMLPARQVPSREVPVSSVINKTQETDTTGTQTNDQPNNPTGKFRCSSEFSQKQMYANACPL